MTLSFLSKNSGDFGGFVYLFALHTLVYRISERFRKQSLVVTHQEEIYLENYPSIMWNCWWSHYHCLVLLGDLQTKPKILSNDKQYIQACSSWKTQDLASWNSLHLPGLHDAEPSWKRVCEVDTDVLDSTKEGQLQGMKMVLRKLATFSVPLLPVKTELSWPAIV